MTRLPAALAAAALTLLLAAQPAAADPLVDVGLPDGAATLAPDVPTTVTVTGSGFQVVQGGFGGVYVLFGTVTDPAGDAWRPSAGGRTGAELRYAADTESADNSGHQVFVAFPGSSTAEGANGGLLTDDGGWQVELVVPGVTFTTVDRDGVEATVDCRLETCGVITIGAHGVVNASNETFTPVRFAADDAPTAGQTASPAPAPASTPEPTATTPVADGNGPPPARSVAPLAVAGVATAAVLAGAAALRRRRPPAGPSDPRT